LDGVTVSLQRGANDIVNAMDMVAECKEELLEVLRTHSRRIL